MLSKKNVFTKDRDKQNVCIFHIFVGLDLGLPLLTHVTYKVCEKNL